MIRIRTEVGLRLEGALDVSVCRLVEAELVALLAQDRDIELDASGLTAVDESGLDLLLRATQRGLRIVCTTQYMRTMLRHHEIPVSEVRRDNR